MRSVQDHRDGPWAILTVLLLICKYWGIIWANLALWALGIYQSWVGHSFASHEDVVVSSGKPGCALSRARSMKGRFNLGFHASAWFWGSSPLGQCLIRVAQTEQCWGLGSCCVCRPWRGAGHSLCGKAEPGPSGVVPLSSVPSRQGNDCLGAKPLSLALLQAPRCLQTMTAHGFGCHKHNVPWCQEQLTHL